MVSGFSSSDQELSKIGLYYSCAKTFGFTPSQVDEIENVVIEGMLILEKARSEKEADEIRRASKR